MVLWPEERKRYRCRFRLNVSKGCDFDIVVEGEGTLSEEECKDQDTLLLASNYLVHSAQIFTKTP